MTAPLPGGGRRAIVALRAAIEKGLAEAPKPVEYKAPPVTQAVPFNPSTKHNTAYFKDLNDEMKKEIAALNDELPEEILDLLTDNLYGSVSRLPSLLTRSFSDRKVEFIWICSFNA